MILGKTRAQLPTIVVHKGQRENLPKMLVLVVFNILLSIRSMTNIIYNLDVISQEPYKVEAIVIIILLRYQEIEHRPELQTVIGR